MAAPPLAGRAGFWTWEINRLGFPVVELARKMKAYGQNFTAIASFDLPDHPEPNGAVLATRIARRAREFNDHGILPLVYVYNWWADPSIEDGRLPERNRQWERSLADALEGLDVIISPCLEPRSAAYGLCLYVRGHFMDRGFHVAHNSNDFHLPGCDYYEAGVPGFAPGQGKPHFLNGDHHHRGHAAWGNWLGQFNWRKQIELIESVPASMGLLMVTEMWLGGENGKLWGLPGWPDQSALADWAKKPEVWQAMGDRTRVVQPEPEPKPPPKPREDPWVTLARAENDLQKYGAGLPWKIKDWPENVGKNGESALELYIGRLKRREDALKGVR